MKRKSGGEPSRSLTGNEDVQSNNLGSQTKTTDGPPPAKRSKRQRGQNKHRPRAAKLALSSLLCPSLYQGDSSSTAVTCNFGEKCRYCHDCAQFLSQKPPDLGTSCYLFDTFGKCSFGLACRFGSVHMTSDGQNVTNEDRFDPNRADVTQNVISKSLQEKLRKRSLKLPKSEVFLKKFGSGRESNKVKNARESGEKGENQKETVAENRKEKESAFGSGLNSEVCHDVQSLAESVTQSFTETGNSSVQSFTETENSSVQSFTETEKSSAQSFTESGKESIQSCSESVNAEGGSFTDVGVVKTTGAVTDEDITRLRPAEKKPVKWCIYI